MTTVVRFKDGSESDVTICAASGDYKDGLTYSFLVGVATRGDGIKRVIFLTPEGDHEEQADRWIESVRADVIGQYGLRMIVGDFT